MRHALRNYESADPGDEVRTYGILMAQANRQIALRRQRENEEAIKSRLSGKASHAAPASPGQQHCAQWVSKGSCKKGAKCNSKHDANRKGSPATSSATVVPAASITALAHADTKGEGKGKDKRGSPNAKGGGKGKDDYPPPRGASASSRPCFEFSKGKCSRADRCPFTHRKPTSEGIFLCLLLLVLPLLLLLLLPLSLLLLLLLSLERPQARVLLLPLLINNSATIIINHLFDWFIIIINILFYFLRPGFFFFLSLSIRNLFYGLIFFSY